jgi:hypothetical protein
MMVKLTVEMLKEAADLLRKRKPFPDEYIIVMHPDEFKRECAEGGRLHDAPIRKIRGGYMVGNQMVMLSKFLSTEWAYFKKPNPMLNIRMEEYKDE